MAEKEAAPAPKEKKAAKKEGKKPHVNKPTSKKYTHYSGKESKLRYCPRCGPGVFMANRGDRVHCGKCSYTEFSSKK